MVGISLTQRLRASLAVSTGLVVVLCVGGTLGGPVSASVAECTLPAGDLEVSDLPEGSSVVACDAVGRSISSQGLQVEIPEPGTAVSMEVMRPGDSDEFTVVVSDSGIVDYQTPAEAEATTTADATAQVSQATGNPECNQDAFNTHPKKWYSTWNWWIGDGVHPAGTTFAEFRDVAIDSVNNVTWAFNDCGRPDSISATQSYKGANTHESNIRNVNGDVECGTPDGFSIIDAGTLAGTRVLAATCAWYVPHDGRDQITEADIKFDTSREFLFTLSPDAKGCDWEFDVESVLTHEVGHAYGMTHVSEATYPRMTMSTATNPCDRSARTLGKGDMLGLESMY